MGFNEFMTKLFGNKSQRDLKEITPYVDKIKAVYPSIQKLSNDWKNVKRSGQKLTRSKRISLKRWKWYWKRYFQKSFLS